MIRPPTRLERLAVLALSMAATDQLCRWMVRRAGRPSGDVFAGQPGRAASGNRDMDLVVAQLEAAEFRRLHGAHNPWAN